MLDSIYLCYLCLPGMRPVCFTCSIPGPFPVTCLMVGSMVLTLAPEDHFLLPANGTSAGNVSDAGVRTLVDTEAMEARRIVVASTMTVLVGIIQVGRHPKRTV